MSEWPLPPSHQETKSLDALARRTWTHPAKAAVVAGILAVTAACGAGDDGTSPSDRATQSTSTPSAPTTPAPTPTATAPPTEQVIPGKTIGTPDNPYKPGDSFSVLDDWTITVGVTDTDTWPDVAANFPYDIEQYEPGPGMMFVSAPATMTYAGPHFTQDRVFGLSAYYIPFGGEPHKVGTCGRYGISVPPFNELSIVEVPSESAFFCAEVPQQLAANGQWRITMYYYDEANREHLLDVYYAIS